jgi:hypothetical protein
MLGATIASPDRQALRFLGIAIAVSVVLAFPMEQVKHSSYALGFYWGENSCGSVEFLLNLGMVFQAILVPLFVFLLPGPGSIFQSRGIRASSVPSSSLPVVRALARPEDHRGARSRRTRSSVEARSLIVVVAVVIGIIGILMFLRSGWQLKHIEFFPGKSPSTSVTWLRAAAFSQTVIEFIVGLAGIAAAVYMLYLYTPSQPALFMLVGWLSAAAVPFVWWYGVRGYAGLHGACLALFEGRDDPFHVDFVSDCAHYFKYLGGFSAVWLGVTAGGLRLQSARAAEGDSSGNELRRFQNFFWAYLLGWAVQYRLAEWLTGPTRGTNVEQEWVTYSVLSFVYLTASSLWSLAFIRFFWNLKARTRMVNVAVLFGGSFVVCILTMLTFFWLFLWAPLAMLPLFTWNLSGGAWALTVGTWRWRALQKQASIPVAAAVGTQPQERRPALLGLRAVEIVGLAVGVFMLVALVLGFVAFYYVTYRFRHHQ